MTDLANFRARLKNAQSDHRWTCLRYLAKNWPANLQPQSPGEALQIIRNASQQPGVSDDIKYLGHVAHTLEVMLTRSGEDDAAYLSRIKHHQYVNTLREITNGLLSLLEKL